jgi:16S rRNA (uracil1498-N3)-methyltransferase
VHLGFAVAKGKRLDWLLEKACELGVASMTPVRFQRSVAGGVGAGGSKRRRWEATCISAAKQCGADHLSRIGQEADLETFLASARGAKLLGQAGAPRISDVLDLSAQSICLLVGPEGGLTGQERDRAVESGFAPVAVGGHTLRIETAGVALLAGVRSLFPGF